MNLSDVLENGGLVPSTPVVETVSWTHPGKDGQDVTDTFTVRIRKHSAGTMEEMWDLVADGKRKRGHLATVISESVLLGDEGDAKLPYDKAFKLDPALADLLIDAIDKVNPIKKKTVAAAKN